MSEPAPDEASLRARVADLEAQNAELARRLKLYAPPDERLPGGRVVLVFFGLICSSLLVAFVLWSSGRRTARERAARPVQAASSTRVDQAGWAMIQGVHRCLAETRPSEDIEVRLEIRLAPAGTIGLIDASIRPGREPFVPCVRKIPADVRVSAEPGEDAPKIEVKYLVEQPQPGIYQARWWWRPMPLEQPSVHCGRRLISAQHRPLSRR